MSDQTSLEMLELIHTSAYFHSSGGLSLFLFSCLESILFNFCVFIHRKGEKSVVPSGFSQSAEDHSYIEVSHSCREKRKVGEQKAESSSMESRRHKTQK